MMVHQKILKEWMKKRKMIVLLTIKRINKSI
jgi:hypothetical protein